MAYVRLRTGKRISAGVPFVTGRNGTVGRPDRALFDASSPGLANSSRIATPRKRALLEPVLERVMHLLGWGRYNGYVVICTPSPGDVPGDGWAFVAPYLTLLSGHAPQRKHGPREPFDALRWPVVCAGESWRRPPRRRVVERSAAVWAVRSRRLGRDQERWSEPLAGGCFWGLRHPHARQGRPVTARCITRSSRKSKVGSRGVLCAPITNHPLATL